MKKIYLGVASALAGLAIAPAVMAEPEPTLGTVTPLASDGCGETLKITPTMDPTTAGETPVSIINLNYPDSAICLKYQTQQGASEGTNERPADKAWLGFKVTAAEDMSNNDTAIIKFPSGKTFTFKDALDTPSTTEASIWWGFDADTLKSLTEAGDETHTFPIIIDWNGAEAEGGEQTINLNIYTNKINLQKTDSTEYAFTTEQADANIQAAKDAEADDDQPAETPAAPAEEDNTNPDTADPVALYATIAVVALLGLGATAVVVHKSRR